MKKFVYEFTEGGKDEKDLLGGKGANLAEMTRLGLPVPPGFTVTTEACRQYLADGVVPPELRVQVTRALRALEDLVGRQLGDPQDPLLVSVRSGAKFSMPGMMETVLNIGLNDASVRGLAAVSGDERFAWDSYRRLIAMFGKTVLDIEGELFAGAMDALKRDRGVTGDVELTADDLEELVETFKKIVQAETGRAFPQHPREQLDLAIDRGVRLVEHRAGPAVPAPRADPARPGHRGERVHDGVRQPGRRLGHRGVLHPRPGHRQAGRLRRLPAQRAGRGRRRRHPQHAHPGRPRRARPGVGEAAVRGDAPAGDPLPGPVRHRVHRRARQAVDAADPRRQAHGRGGVPDRRPARRRAADHPGRGAAAGHRRAAGPADVPAVRPVVAADAAGEGPGRVTGCGGGCGGVRLRGGGGAARGGGVGRCWCAGRPTRTTSRA